MTLFEIEETFQECNLKVKSFCAFPKGVFGFHFQLDEDLFVGLDYHDDECCHVFCISNDKYSGCIRWPIDKTSDTFVGPKMVLGSFLDDECVDHVSFKEAVNFLKRMNGAHELA